MFQDVMFSAFSTPIFFLCFRTSSRCLTWNYSREQRFRELRSSAAAACGIAQAADLPLLPLHCQVHLYVSCAEMNDLCQLASQEMAEHRVTGTLRPETYPKGYGLVAKAREMWHGIV